MEQALERSGAPTLAHGLSKLPDSISSCLDRTWNVCCSDGFETVLDADRAPIQRWIEEGEVQPVKVARHRAVFRVRLEGWDFHIKFYPVVGTRQWLNRLLRATKGRLEYERGVSIVSRGIPTNEPLAFGEASDGSSFVVTRTLTDVVPLNDFLQLEFPALPRAERTELRQELANELGQFVGRMHEAGVLYRDLHPGNLLLKRTTERLALYLIDVHDVALGATLPWSRAAENLVVLNRWFSLRSQATDRARFWRAYSAVRSSSIPKEAVPQRELERATFASNLNYWRKHDKNCLQSSRHFIRIGRPNVVGHRVADIDESWLESLLGDPDAPFDDSNARMLKDGDTSTVIELEMPTASGPVEVIYKRFAVKSSTDSWASLFRQPAALRCFVWGHGLRNRNLPTPRPLVVFHRKRAGLLYEGYLLQEKLPDARELPTYLAELDGLPGAERRERKARLIDELARLFADLHARGLSHRDTKASNILVSSRPWVLPRRDGRQPASIDQGSGAHLWLVDLVGVTLPTWLSRSRKVQNLARLHASFHQDSRLSRTDKLRFLERYLGGEFTRTWKEWWNDIDSATQSKIGKNLRNKRPLT